MENPKSMDLVFKETPVRRGLRINMVPNSKAPASIA